MGDLINLISIIDWSGAGKILSTTSPPNFGLVSAQQANTVLEEERFDSKTAIAAKLLQSNPANATVMSLDTSYIEEMARAGRTKVFGLVLRSRVDLLVFSLFFFFALSSATFFLFILVAVTEGYLIIDPYDMLFGALGFLGLALTAWQTMKKRAMVWVRMTLVDTKVGLKF